MKLTLRLLTGRFAVCQLPAGTVAPDWAMRSVPWAVMATREEVSAVCAEEAVPVGVKSQGGWRCLQIEGPFAFDVTGVLASVVGPLAGARVPVFALSTYNTDYVMVPGEHATQAVEVLRAAGHDVDLLG